MTHHVVAEIDCVGEALGVSAAVTLYHDAVEAQENTSVGLARIHLARERAESPPRQKVTEPSRHRAIHLLLEVLAQLTRGAFGSLEGNVAGKAFGHHHSDGRLADISTFAEADIFELRRLTRTQPLTCLAHGLHALHLLHADLEQPRGRPM